jgi:hypothetical protein
MARVVGPAKIEVQKCHLAGHGRGFQLNVGGVGWPSGLDGRLCTARDCRDEQDSAGAEPRAEFAGVRFGGAEDWLSEVR